MRPVQVGLEARGSHSKYDEEPSGMAWPDDLYMLKAAVW